MTAGHAEAPPAPAGAESVFGGALESAERYAGLLAGPAVERGLIGPHEVGRLWDRHLLNSAAVAGLVPSPSQVVDLGSGAGLPGIVLALLLPECEVTLLEPMLRRVTFLKECVDALALPNARVVRGRAEDWAGKLAADVVTARAVAPLDRLVPLAMGLLRPGGLLLAVKGARAAEELAAAKGVLRRFGMRDVAVVAAGSGVVAAGDGKVDQAATVVRMAAGR